MNNRTGNLTNYHSHSLYCDGRANMEDFVRFALSEGFTSYGFSSHAPRHYKIFCVNGNTGFKFESRIFYFIHLQNEEDYERKESSGA